MAKEDEDVICPECDGVAERVTTKYGRLDKCCGLWSWGGKALVTGETHQARKAAHKTFDKVWKQGCATRSDAYAALASHMDMKIADCHMATMTETQCYEVLTAVAHLWPGLVH